MRDLNAKAGNKVMKGTLSIDLDHINTEKNGSLVQKKKIDKFFEEHQRHL